MMTDREKTAFLTKLGFLKLKDMGCYAISTEINVHTWLLPTRALRANNHHHYIDILGLQEEYLPIAQRKEENGIAKKTRTILRGIEVKVSKSDFKNGYVKTGCHYNYLLTQKGLINPLEVPREIGILEVDLSFYPKLATAHWLGVIQLKRNATKQSVPERIVDLCKGDIDRTLTNQAIRWLEEMLYQNNSVTANSNQVK